MFNEALEVGVDVEIGGRLSEVGGGWSEVGGRRSNSACAFRPPISDFRPLIADFRPPIISAWIRSWPSPPRPQTACLEPCSVLEHRRGRCRGSASGAGQD